MRRHWGCRRLRPCSDYALPTDAMRAHTEEEAKRSPRRQSWPQVYPFWRDLGQTHALPLQESPSSECFHHFTYTQMPDKIYPRKWRSQGPVLRSGHANSNSIGIRFRVPEQCANGVDRDISVQRARDRECRR